jgi:hypothetical protein
MLIAAGPYGPVIVLVPAALVVGVLWLAARGFSRSPRQRLVSLLLGGSSTVVTIGVLMARFSNDAWEGTWFGSLLDHYWVLFLIVAMTGGAALGAAAGAWGATNHRRPPTPPGR